MAILRARGDRLFGRGRSLGQTSVSRLRVEDLLRLFVRAVYGQDIKVVGVQDGCDIGIASLVSCDKLQRDVLDDLVVISTIPISLMAHSPNSP